MKKKPFAIVIVSLALLLIIPAWGQPRPGKARRKIQPKQPSNFSWGESSSGSQQQNNRRKQPRNRAKQQAIEVENDETHRTKPQVTRTETVDKDETISRKRRAKNPNGHNRKIPSQKPSGS